MKVKDKIIIKTDFSDSPGARYKKDGMFSGEEFLEILLEPKFVEALKGDYQIEIDLDGVWGYPSSFVSGSFGVLSLKFGSDKVLKHLIFKSDENEPRKNKVISEIENPETY